MFCGYYCEDNGCTKDAIPVFDSLNDQEPTAYYCVKHAIERGYCGCCGVNEFKVGPLDQDGCCDRCYVKDFLENHPDYI